MYFLQFCIPWLVFANLIQNRVPRKKGPQKKNCFHQRALELACEGISLDNGRCGRTQSTVDYVTHGQAILGCLSEHARISKPVSSFSPWFWLWIPSVADCDWHLKAK